MGILNLYQITKIYGAGETAVPAVNDVSLEVGVGEIALITGPSGSGKTTLLLIAGALLKPTSGRVFLQKKEITYLTEKQLPDIRLSSIGFVFQDFSLLPSLTALENVEFVIAQAGGPKNRARSLLEELGLAKRLNFLPHQLSGGEKQRVAIARSLANQPALVLADEPTANLDSQSGAQVIEHLCRLTKQENRGAIIVSHDQRIIPFVDTNLWLEDGRLYRVKRD